MLLQLLQLKDIINPYNCLLEKATFQSEQVMNK